MRASLQFECETLDDFVILARALAHLGASNQASHVQAPVVHAGAPAPQAAVSPPPKAVEVKAEEPAPAPEPALAEEDAGGEVVDKSLVAKELREFIKKHGEGGPKKALGVLKQFGANKFDELKAENYGKFLSALSKEV